MKTLKQIIELLSNDQHITSITYDKVIEAKAVLLTTPNTNKELFKILVAMNLINAALKLDEYKGENTLIYYGMLKPRVSRLVHQILDNKQKFDIDFYIDNVNCLYIEIEGLQFSFHNIIIDKPLKEFINSTLNKPKPWKGVQLQKVAGELFDYTFIN